MKAHGIGRFSPATLFLALGALTAYGQATRTWVSGVGDDVNPCSRTAPCKTFAGAISKTAAGGEISALDPGGYGVVTITKSITISGDATLAGILSASTNGVVVNAGVNDVVTLRNISIDGAGTGVNGIRFLAGKALVIDRVTSEGLNASGHHVQHLSSGGNLIIKNSVFQGGQIGVLIGTSGRAAIDGTTIVGAINGVHAAGGVTTVTRSLISMNNGTGLLAEGSGVLNVQSTIATGNYAGVSASGAGATVRLSNVDIMDNYIGISCAGGTIASAGDNRQAGNTSTCSPNATITVQ